MEQPRPAMTDGTTVYRAASSIDSSLDELAVPQLAKPLTRPSGPIQPDHGQVSELVDISVGGAVVRIPSSSLAASAEVVLQLPAGKPVKLHQVRQLGIDPEGHTVVSRQLPLSDRRAYRTLSLRLFHTPPDAIPSLDPGVSAVAISGDRSAPTSRTLVRRYGQRP